MSFARGMNPNSRNGFKKGHHNIYGFKKGHPNYNTHTSEETKEKIRQKMLGRTLSNEARLKVSKSQIGENNSNWKGDSVGVDGLHDWIKRKLGTPFFCEGCGTESSKVFDWANKTGLYLRDLNDWIRLCRKCHVKYDKIGKKLRGGARLAIYEN